MSGADHEVVQLPHKKRVVKAKGEMPSPSLEYPSKMLDMKQPALTPHTGRDERREKGGTTKDYPEIFQRYPPHPPLELRKRGVRKIFHIDTEHTIQVKLQQGEKHAT